MEGGNLRAGSGRRWAWEWIKSIAIGVGLFMLLRTFVLEAFRIPSGSMENTLLAGDYVLVNKAIYGPKLPFTHWSLPGIASPERGDIVVFEPPHDAGRSYVKRLVAVPGDTVEMQDRELRVNGDKVAEPYALRSNRQDVHPASALWQCRYMPGLSSRDCDPSRDTWGPVVVPEDQYLVLGDNRDDSEDSRYWGFVPRDAIRGRPLVVYFSVGPESWYDDAGWSDRVRWNRIGHALD
jgi:signal peptidase I